MKVLIVEDDEQSLYLARYLLEARGHEVHDARDGLEGLAAARADRFDVIVLDIQLPRLDGFQVARKLRSLADCRRVPIIAVTAHVLPDDQEAALAAGCDGYLAKPVDPDTFAEQVEAIARGD